MPTASIIVGWLVAWVVAGMASYWVVVGYSVGWVVGYLPGCLVAWYSTGGCLLKDSKGGTVTTNNYQQAVGLVGL